MGQYSIKLWVSIRCKLTGVSDGQSDRGNRTFLNGFLAVFVIAACAIAGWLLLLSAGSGRGIFQIHANLAVNDFKFAENCNAAALNLSVDFILRVRPSAPLLTEVNHPSRINSFS